MRRGLAALLLAALALSALPGAAAAKRRGARLDGAGSPAANGVYAPARGISRRHLVNSRGVELRRFGDAGEWRISVPRGELLYVAVNESTSPPAGGWLPVKGAYPPPRVLPDVDLASAAAAGAARLPGDAAAEALLARAAQGAPPEDALALAEQALADADDELELSRAVVAEGRFAGAAALRALGRPEEAEAWLRQALAADGAHARAGGALGELLAARGDDAGALAALRAAAEAQPHNADALYALAAQLERQGELAEAADAYHAAADLLVAQGIPAWTADGEELRYARALHGEGRALLRLGRRSDADAAHDRGFRLGLWRSPYQRFVARPEVWIPSAAPWVDADSALFPRAAAELLEASADDIRAEALGLDFEDGLRLADGGEWVADGAPRTRAVLEQVPDLEACMRAHCAELTAFFSRLRPGAAVAPRCGPTNLRQRLHLALEAPAGAEIRVANETRAWEQGRVLVFDDSYEHEMWHSGSGSGSGDLLVLVVDVWQPEAPVVVRG